MSGANAPARRKFLRAISRWVRKVLVQRSGCSKALPPVTMSQSLMNTSLETIQAFVSPVVMVSANGLMCLAFYNRLTRLSHAAGRSIRSGLTWPPNCTVWGRWGTFAGIAAPSPSNRDTRYHRRAVAPKGSFGAADVVLLAQRNSLHVGLFFNVGIGVVQPSRPKHRPGILCCRNVDNDVERGHCDSRVAAGFGALAGGAIGP